MKNSFKFIILLTVLGTCRELRGEMQPAKLTKPELVGEWAGCAWDCTEFYRLELSSNGIGSLVILQPRLNSDVYSIGMWDLRDGAVVFNLTPQGDSETLEIRTVHLDRRYLQFEISGLQQAWKRSITLYNVKELDDRLERTRKAARQKNIKQ